MKKIISILCATIFFVACNSSSSDSNSADTATATTDTTSTTATNDTGWISLFDG